MVAESKMKQTEIGLIPEDWKLVDLSELSSKIASGKSNTLNNDNGIYPIYGSTGIIGLKKYFDYEGAKITVARVGANAGYISIIDGKYCISDNTLFVQSNDKVIINFLYKYLQSINLNKYVFGSGQPLITGTILKNLQIPLPSLPEQQAIAEALSDADAWIESLEQLIAKKRLVKQGAMQELLTPPSHAEPAEAWEVKKLGEISEILIGLTYSPNDVKEYGTLVLRSSNIQNNKLAFENNVFVDMELPQRVVVKENDLLVCVRNGSKQLIGKCALIDKKTEGQAFGAFMSIIRSNLGKYLYYYFQSYRIQTQIDENLGATINQLTNATLKAFEIYLPKSKEEQTRIATILSDIDAELEALEAQLAKAQQIKQGMMQELLTGRVRLV